MLMEKAHAVKLSSWDHDEEPHALERANSNGTLQISRSDVSIADSTTAAEDTGKCLT